VSGIKTKKKHSNESERKVTGKGVKQLLVAEIGYTVVPDRLYIYSQIKTGALQTKMLRHCMSYGATVMRQYVQVKNYRSRKTKETEIKLMWIEFYSTVFVTGL
jgi:hypothetical protein